MGKWQITAVLVALLVAGCDLPWDADGATDRIRRHQVLRVGFTANPPWVEVEHGQPRGIEPRLIEAFASEFGAKPVWIAGAESSLAKALRDRRIDVLIGGHDRNSPWISHAAATEPYIRATIIVAAPADRPDLLAVRSDLRGRTVAHEDLRPDLGALIAAKSGKPEVAAHLSGRLAAVYDFQASRHRLAPTGIVLATTEKVLLVAPGESRLLFLLDSFLARHGRSAANASPELERP